MGVRQQRIRLKSWRMRSPLATCISAVDRSRQALFRGLVFGNNKAAVPTCQIRATIDLKTLHFKQRCDGSALLMADFDAREPSRRKLRLENRSKYAIVIKPIFPREQCAGRLPVSDAAWHCLVGRYIRRVTENEVKGFAGSIPVTDAGGGAFGSDSLDVGPRDAQRGVGRISSDARRSGPMIERGKEQGARARAKIKHAARPGLPEMGDGCFHQRFAIRPWDEDARANFESDSPEVARASDVRNGFVSEAARDQRFEDFGNNMRTEEQRFAADSQRVRKQ